MHAVRSVNLNEKFRLTFHMADEVNAVELKNSKPFIHTLDTQQDPPR
jgi:hypothetical protein